MGAVCLIVKASDAKLIPSLLCKTVCPGSLLSPLPSADVDRAGHTCLQTKWDETDEKPAVIGIGVATFVAIWATSGLVDRIDKLPLIGGGCLQRTRDWQVMSLPGRKLAPDNSWA